ncbi:hypothetical protein CPB85DRAFT_1319326, partial [Mucidula mucida]
MASIGAKSDAEYQPRVEGLSPHPLSFLVLILAWRRANAIDSLTSVQCAKIPETKKYITDSTTMSASSRFHQIVFEAQHDNGAKNKSIEVCRHIRIRSRFE